MGSGGRRGSSTWRVRGRAGCLLAFLSMTFVGLPAIPAHAVVAVPAGSVDSTAADSPLLPDAGAADTGSSAVALSPSRTLPGFQGSATTAAATPTASANSKQMEAAIGARLATARASLAPRTDPPFNPSSARQAGGGAQPERF